MNQEQLSSIWPDWVLVQKLGQGSYGGVYEIQRVLPGGRIEKAALKQITIPRSQDEIDSLFAQSVSEKSISDYFRSQLQKLVQEYTMMRQLGECPNIVACQDLSYRPNGYGWDLYFRMELLTPLKRVLDNQYHEMRVIRLGLEVCNALEACGSLNIIHRDIKPENILVSEKGVFKLGDFGIAKTSEGTQTGTMAGTYGYMAPEVANRQHYGALADIYSLGMVLYWMMNQNTLPFLPLPPRIPTASQRQDAMNLRFSGTAIPAPKNGSSDLKRIVLKACAFAPADRYHSVSDMKKALYELYRWKQNQSEEILQEIGLSASMIAEDEIPKLKEVRSSTGSIQPQIHHPNETGRLRKRYRPILIGFCMVLIVIAFGLFMLQRSAPAELEKMLPEMASEAEPIPIVQLPEETKPEIVTTETEGETVSILVESTEPTRMVNVECTYDFNDSGVTITGCSGVLPAEAVLPDTIDGVAVTKIGENAFISATALRKVWLPEGILEIGEKAFSGCSKLQNVYFPAGLIRIGASAFENCSSLSSVSLPKGITGIAPWAFANCKRLVALEIPGTVTTLGEWSFSGCSGLGSIELEAGITTIENYVFYDCKRLTEINIPEGVKTIGIGAFSGCEELADVTLPKSLRTLSAEAFLGTSLKAINVNRNCSLGDEAVPLGCAIYQS